MTLLELTNAYYRSRMIGDIQLLVQNCLQFAFVNSNKLMKHWTIIPSSPKGGCTNPPNGFCPGAQNRTAKGQNCSGYLQVHPFPSFWRKNSESTAYTGGRVSFQSWEVGGLVRSPDFWIGYFENIWSDMHSQVCCKLEWPFSNIFCKKSHENRMFLRFFT